MDVGVDIVEIHRIAKQIHNPRFLKRVFTSPEVAYCRARKNAAQHFAVRFAAKEAVSKALGAPVGLKWHDCEVITDSAGRPYVRVSGTVAAAAAQHGVCRWHVSLSHHGGMALATVIGVGSAE